MAQLFHIGSEFWKQVLTLLSGSLLAQVISVLMLPVLSRLYLPEAFGVFAAFVAAVAVLVVLINGGYELCIMLPEKEEEAEILMRLSLRVAHGFSFLLLIILGAFGPFLLELAQLNPLKYWHLLLPISIWMEGMIQVLGFRLNRMRAYHELSISKIIRSGLTAGVSVGLAFILPGFEGLLIGFVSGQLGMAVYGYFVYLRKGKNLRLKVKQSEFRKIAKAYSDFPRYSVLSAALNTASKHLPFFLLPGLFNTYINGQFSKADRVLNLPAVLVSMSIGRVFFEQASRATKLSDKSLSELSKNTFLRLFILAIPFFLIVMIWAPDLFSFVLGKPWRLAGEYARCLMPWMFMVFMASPLSYLIDIKRKLKIFLFFNLALFFVRFLALILGAHYLDDMGTMWAFGISGAFMVLLQLIYLLYLGEVNPKPKSS